MPDFVAPELCTPVDRPPNGEGWCHEIKFDGYRVQLRVEGGKAILKTRKGLDWTDKFGAIAKEGGRAARCADRRRDRRARPSWRAGFLHAAGRHFRWQDRQPDLLCIRSVVRRRPRPSPPAAWRAQGATEGAAGKRAPRQRANRSATSSISKAAATPSSNRRASCHWKASSRKNSAPPIVPDVPKAGPRPNAAPGRRSCSADGRPPTANSAR